MALPPLADPADLAGLYGAPFTEAAVNIGGASLRNAAHWHIAPEITETLAAESKGGRDLLLPTGLLVTVTEVRHVTDSASRVLTGWRIHPEAAGVLTGIWWPVGRIEADVTHGYDECPPELLPLLAEACRSQGSDRRIRSQANGPFSVTYDGTSSTPDPTLSRYTLPPRP